MQVVGWPDEAHSEPVTTCSIHRTISGSLTEASRCGARRCKPRVSPLLGSLCKRAKRLKQDRVRKCLGGRGDLLDPLHHFGLCDQRRFYLIIG